MAKVNNVTNAKPKIGGAIYVAPVGTSLPTDTTTELTSFKKLGYCSDDGLTNSTEIETANQKAWGGDNVLNMQISKTDTFNFKLIEALNVDVLKTVYGNNNVTGDLSTGITVEVKNEELEPLSWIFEIILQNGALKRIIVPSAVITETGEIAYKDDEAVGYEITISADSDENGLTHYEYIKSKGE